MKIRKENEKKKKKKQKQKMKKKKKKGKENKLELEGTALWLRADLLLRALLFSLSVAEVK